MTRLTRIVLSLLVGMAVGAPLLAAPEDTAPSGDSVTVGDFLLRLAAAMSLPLEDDDTPAAALAALQAALTLDRELDLEADLTEGDVVYLAARLDIQMATLQPDRLFPGSRLETFFQLFGKALAQAAGDRAKESPESASAPAAEQQP